MTAALNFFAMAARSNEKPAPCRAPRARTATRFSTTRRRYSAVERTSSMGVTSSFDQPLCFRELAAAAGDIRFQFVRAHNNRRDAAEGDAMADRGHHYLRDRLRRARADLVEALRPLGHLDLDADDELVGAAHRPAIAGVVLTPAARAARPRAERSTTVASAAISTGTPSAAGEPFSMLPASVPRFWICTPPTWRAASTRIGSRLRTALDSMQSV